MSRNMAFGRITGIWITDAWWFYDFDTGSRSSYASINNMEPGKTARFITKTPYFMQMPPWSILDQKISDQLSYRAIARIKTAIERGFCVLYNPKYHQILAFRESDQMKPDEN